MNELEQISQTLALSMGAAWGSGINLYATLLMLGYLAHTGNIDLPPDLMIVADPLVMAAAGLMYAVEFFADKIPGVDTGWDTLHTFVRIPAGAMLAAGAIGDIGPAAEIAAALVGGSLAAATQAAAYSSIPHPSHLLTGPPQLLRMPPYSSESGRLFNTRAFSLSRLLYLFC